MFPFPHIINLFARTFSFTVSKIILTTYLFQDTGTSYLVTSPNLAQIHKQCYFLSLLEEVVCDYDVMIKPVPSLLLLTATTSSDPQFLPGLPLFLAFLSSWRMFHTLAVVSEVWAKVMRLRHIRAGLQILQMQAAKQAGGESGGEKKQRGTVQSCL